MPHFHECFWKSIMESGLECDVTNGKHNITFVYKLQNIITIFRNERQWNFQIGIRERNGRWRLLWVYVGTVEPYQDDPVASENDGSSSGSSDYEDEDQISRQELEKRYKGIIPVSSWYVNCFKNTWKSFTCGHLERLFLYFIVGANVEIAKANIWSGHANIDVVTN